MYGMFIALFIAVAMILFMLHKAHNAEISAFICTKSELAALLEQISDDCTIHILIGRKHYEHYKRNSRR